MRSAGSVAGCRSGEERQEPSPLRAPGAREVDVTAWTPASDPGAIPGSIPAPDGTPDPAVPGPDLARTRAELGEARSSFDGTVAVVMTMGALHEGHTALVRHARTEADHVIVTIFLNPLQA